MIMKTMAETAITRPTVSPSFIEKPWLASACNGGGEGGDQRAE